MDSRAPTSGNAPRESCSKTVHPTNPAHAARERSGGRTNRTTENPRGRVRRAIEGEPLSIGALSRATGIPTETLRTWERRYGAPASIRKPSGHRLYPVSTVQHLRRVGRLLAQGHRPADILPLADADLDALLALSEPTAPRPTGRERPRPSGLEPLGAIGESMRAASNLDRETLVGELRASWARLGPLRFLEDVVAPLLVAIGEAWRKRTFEVRHEHFAFACVADFLREVRAPHDAMARGPRVVAATPAGELHEGGLLMAAVVLAQRGFQVAYLGPNTPIEQIAAAGSDADIVAVSLVAGSRRRRAAESIERLRSLLPRRIALWTGGAGAPEAPRGVERFANLDELDASLAGGE